jgi:hypothetical protein
MVTEVWCMRCNLSNPHGSEGVRGAAAEGDPNR